MLRDKLMFGNKRYSLLNKNFDIKQDDIDKKIQIEKIKKVFKDNDEKNNIENEKFHNELYNLNFKSKNIETFKNFSLLKDTINPKEMNSLSFLKKNQSSNLSNKNNKDMKNKSENEEKIETPIELSENININNNKKTDEKMKEKNINNNMLNVTQEQMEIFDKGVNQLYNQHKNNIKLKMFQINHPYLHNIKLINNKLESISSLMTKEQRMLPILQKQNLILKKIQKNNISKSNSSISRINNNDSIDHSIINNNININENKSEKVFFNKNYKKQNLELNSNYIFRTLDNNINYNYNYSNSSSDNQNDINLLNTKKSINKRKLNYKPYTLEQYKNKYENNIIKNIGGLGPNIGGENWKKRNKILERKKQYSDIIDNEFRSLNKKKISIFNKKYVDIKTIGSSKRDSNLSSDSNKYKVFKTENNIINNNKKELVLPLINLRFKNSNSKIQLKKNKKNINTNNIYNINQEHDIEGNEKDLKQLIKQYEEYNENYKL